MQKSNYEVDILVNGHPVQEYIKDAKHYIEARKGQEFSIRVRNNGFKRIVAVPSVDGLSVINGKEARVNSEGYIVNGHDSLVVDGWRVSDSKVNRFFFTNPENSYAEKKKRSGNLGVVGVAVFREKECRSDVCSSSIFSTSHSHPSAWPPPYFPRFLTDDTVSVSNSLETHYVEYSAARSLSQEIGTGWGKTTESNVTSVFFDREETPDAIFEVYYNTKEQLKRLGIDFQKKPQYITPQAFPGRYCEPPENK